MSASYLNFDLLIDRGPAGYRARVIASPAGEAETDFALPFTDAELAGFLQRYFDGDFYADAPPGLDARGFGLRLYQAVFAGAVGRCLRRSLDEAGRSSAGLRIRLRFDAGAPELAELPWELLYAPDLERLLAPSSETALVRYLPVEHSSRMQPVQPPLVVLAALANPAGVTPLAVEREWQHLQEAVAGLDESQVRLERAPATWAALQARLRQGPVHVLHFVGHGFFDRSQNRSGLVFEDEMGRASIVPAEAFKTLLHDHDALRLVYLNACEGASSGRSDPFSGVAQQLVQMGVPAVVAMQFPVSDAAAITLSREFYRSLAAGYPVDAALGEARKAVLGQSGSPEWATPVLFSRAEDNRLFDLRDALPAPDCPFPGMVPFRAEDARFFYGRESEIQQMLDHLRHQRLLLVIGPSGSGKSSLIAAGLLPRLEKSTYFVPGFWLVRTMRPLDHPAAALAACLEGDVSQADQAVAALLAAHAPAQRLLLVIDQFEEAFSLADKAERQQFMAALQALRRNPQCTLLLALRADFYPDLMNSDLWPVDPGQRLDVAVLRGDALRRAIRQPAADVEVDIDDALIERLVADLAGEPGALPMLQETLVLLWERMRRRQITLGDYEQLGEGERSGLAVAVARKADATMTELAPAEQVIAQRIFLRLIQFGEGNRDTRRQLPVADLRNAADDDQAFERTLEHLARNRLLTTSGEERGGRRADIAHEALIVGWPRLQEWVSQRRVAEQTRRRLEAKATEWIAAGKRGGLLDEYELQEAEHWLAGEDAQELGHSLDLSDLVSASQEAIAQAVTKEAEAIRNRQRSRLFAGGLALAMLVIVLVGYFALVAQTERNQAETAATAEAKARAASDANALEANRQRVVAETAQAQAVVARTTAEAAAAGEAVQRARAEAARVALSAVDQLAVDKERALLLAIYAAQQDASVFADSALRRVLTSPGHTQSFWPALPTQPVWSHSGRKLLIRTAEDDIAIHDTDTGRQQVVAIDHQGPVKRLAWSPDDAYLLVETSAGVQVWSTAVQQTVAVAQGQVASPQVPWSPDGSKVLLRTDQGLSLWDWRNEKITILDAGEWQEIAWSGAGSHLSTFGDGALQVWDTSHSPPRALAPQLTQVGGALWSPLGSRLLIIGADSKLRVWSIATDTIVELATSQNVSPAQDSDLQFNTDVNYDPGNWRNKVAWSPDGTRILTFKDRVQVWDAGNGALLATLHEGSGSATDAYWSPDGDRVLIDDGQQVRIVSADGSRQDPVLLNDTRSINSEWVAIRQPWSPDGRKVITNIQNMVSVWDAGNGSEIATLSSEADIALTAVEWSPGNDHVLGVNETGQVRLWDLKPILTPATIEEQSLESWSPTGKYVVTRASEAAQVWEADSWTQVADLPVAGHQQEISPGTYSLFQIDEWSPDGTKLVIYTQYNIARIVNTANWQSYVDLQGHAGQITDAAWSPTGDRLATASEDGTVRVWDAQSGAAMHVLRGHMGAVNDVDWSPNGAYITSASTDGTVRIWQADTGEQLRVLNGHTASVKHVLWNPRPGSPLLVSVRQHDAKNDHTRIWNAETGEQVATLVGDGAEVRETIWNATGDYLAAVTDDFKVFLWRPGDWHLVPEAQGDAIAWSPDGSYLAADRPDGSIVIWDIVTGTASKEFVGHKGDVNQIDWDRADGKRLVSRGADGKVRLWSLDDPVAVAAINTGTGADYAGVRFSPDGKYLTLWTQSAGVLLLPAQQSDLIRIGCEAAVRNLGPADWREFIAPQDPKLICAGKPRPGVDYPDPRVDTGKG